MAAKKKPRPDVDTPTRRFWVFIRKDVELALRSYAARRGLRHAGPIIEELVEQHLADELKLAREQLGKQ